MLRLAGSGQPIRVVEDHFASPAFAPALAARTLDLVERGQTGVFHVGGGVAISWFEFARLIFEAAGLDPTLTPTNEREYRTSARRPKFSALSNAKMERLGIAPMPPLREALEDYFARRAAQPDQPRRPAPMLDGVVALAGLRFQVLVRQLDLQMPVGAVLGGIRRACSRSSTGCAFRPAAL